MDGLDAAQSLGFTMPSPAYLTGMLLFSLIGFAAYRYGKSMGYGRTRWIGLVLMLFPYVVSDTFAMYLVGLALCGALWWFHQQ